MSQNLNELPELKPCPFCGNAPKYYEHPDNNGDRIICSLGHVRFRTVEGWNTRADTRPESRESKALEAVTKVRAKIASELEGIVREPIAGTESYVYQNPDLVKAFIDELKGGKV